MVHEFHPTSSMEFANQLAANAAASSPAAELVVAGSTEFLADINEQPPSTVTPEGLILPNGQSLLIDQAVGESTPMNFIGSVYKFVEFYKPISTFC